MSLPIILLHGIRVSRTMWQPVLDRLSRPAYAVDLPGHGPRRDERFTIDTAVTAVAQAIDEAGGRALVAGHSMGGYVGIAAAERLPDRVAGLVAIGCTSRSRAMIWAYRTVAGLAARFPQQADRLSARSFRRALPPDAADAVLAGGFTCQTMPDVVRAIAGHDQIAALRAYPGMVWLVNGDRDPFRADEPTFLAACRDGRVVRLPRVGHITALADPDRLARLLEDATLEIEARNGRVGHQNSPADRALR
jgi:pimeloyl-ACP methyl ester carboxylesterase